MNFSQLFDVSVNLRPGLAVWPGDAAVEFQKTGEIAQGGTANVTRLLMSAHTGTHMDAPRHFIEGATGIDEMPLEALVGTVHVLDLTAARTHITAADLQKAGCPEKPERVLFKTRNSNLWADTPDNFQHQYIALALDGAQWLVERGVKLVGIDYLSIEEYEPASPEVHYTLLGNRVVVVEGLDLSGIEPGEYTIFALPLKMQGADGAPARVLLGRN